MKEFESIDDGNYAIYDLVFKHTLENLTYGVTEQLIRIAAEQTLAKQPHSYPAWIELSERATEDAITAYKSRLKAVSVATEATGRMFDRTPPRTTMLDAAAAAFEEFVRRLSKPEPSK